MTTEAWLTMVTENQQKVYNAGIEQGKQSTYDDFWDDYQNKGNRTNYSRAFEGAFWNDNRFKPKHEITVVENANYMFRNTNITDLSNLNIVTCHGAYQMCNAATALISFGNINVSWANVGHGFNACGNLRTIGTITANSNSLFDSTFYGCSSLQEVSFAGTIADSLNMSACPLNRASTESILGCLSKTSTGKTLTLKSGWVDTVFETTDGAGDGREVFESLIAEKTNWRFVY